MGSNLIALIDDRWTSDLAELELWLCELLKSAKDSVQPRAEPGAKNWRTVVLLLGGTNDTVYLPPGWRRDLQLAAGLRAIRLDIRVNPEGARLEIIQDLKVSPPDGLLVWEKWVSSPESFIRPFLAARPSAYAELLGSSKQPFRYEEDVEELLMHLREICPLDSPKPEATASVTTWQDAIACLDGMIGDHFIMTERARNMLRGNPYPYPGRMISHLRALAGIAAAYRERSGQIGSNLTSYAMEEFGIEIALTDSSLTAPAISLDGRILYARPHVKVDDHKTPDRCGRIYFAIDQVGLRFVVDHVGLHDYG